MIVFAKAPVPGRVKTRLGLAPQIAARLHESFVAATLDLCARLEARVELHTDVETPAWGQYAVPRALQASGDLGARMLAALDSRPAPVMIVGSDAPTLPPGHLAELLGALDAHDIALGPADDGGYYAIAARRTHPLMFEGVAWSTADTLDRTVASCRRAGLTVAIGSWWFDVDTPEDLKRLPDMAHHGIGDGTEST
ncbi:MAG: TIGR04282 family arsenosugar biosynthesis glycosyltransferase [Bryobacteraceae bacterium]